MPYLHVKINQPLEVSKRHQFLTHISANTAKALNKPESYVMIDLEVNESLWFAGNQEPVAYLELKSIGLPSDQPKVLSETLSDLLTQQLNIPAGRIYIDFTDIKGLFWGWNGGTF